MSVLNMNIAIAEERLDFYSKLTGQSFDGSVDYDSVDDNALMKSARRERAKEEIIAYMTQCLKEEFKVSDAEDALLCWEEYKIKHNIRIEEQIADE